MKREIDMNEVSDGKLYSSNDLVKADCGDCKGCFFCCQGMGQSIILDPLDIYRLTTNLRVTFEQLLEDKIELNVVDGIILPNLKMGGAREACAFLNEEGRCSIHDFRPGICRLFPLGRFYENHGFKYFLQVHECPKENKTKVKVRKWLDTPNLKKNEQYIIDWHYFLDDVQGKFKTLADDGLMKKIDMFILQQFFIEKYNETEDFYEQFDRRLVSAKKAVDTLLS